MENKVQRIQQQKNDQIFSATVEINLNKLKFLASVLASYDPKSFAFPLDKDDIRSVGLLIYNVEAELREWNEDTDR